MKTTLIASLLLALALFGAPRAEGTKLWWIFLETGKPTPPDKEAVQKMQLAHLANFQRLHGEGVLLSAGPIADPSGKKRGIVLLTAPSHDAMAKLFAPDPYVSNGHMRANAVPCVARIPLESRAVEPDSIEEVRIVLVHQTDAFRKLPAERRDATAAGFEREVHAFAREAEIGSWYLLEAGDIWQVLHSRSLDSDSLTARFLSTTAGREGLIAIDVWPQWIAKGAVHAPSE